MGVEYHSELANEQVADHLSRRDPDSDAKSWQVERRAEDIGQTERKHGRDPTLSKLESPAAILGHHVLLDRSAAKVVHATSGIVLSLESSGGEGVLVTGENVEVVVGLHYAYQSMERLDLLVVLLSDVIMSASR